MFRSRVITLCKASKYVPKFSTFGERGLNPTARIIQGSAISRYSSTTFKAPIPGASITFKSISSEATDPEDYQGVFDGDERGTQEVVQQYSEKSVNTVTLLGRVGINPVLRGTASHPVVAFSLATNIQYRPGGQNSGNDLVKKTDWHNIIVFKDNLRESVNNYVTKGSRIMVQGRIMYGMIEDKQGNMRSTTSIVAEDVIRFA